LNTNGNKSGWICGVYSSDRWSLSGNFDIQIDFDNFSGYGNDGGIALYAYDGVDNYFYVRRRVGPTNRYDRDVIDSGVPVHYQYVNTSDTSGKLRLVRYITHVYAYYWDWNASDWVQIGSPFSGFTTANLFVSFEIGVDNAHCSVDMDNFIMFMNDPSREYFKLYEIEMDRSVFDGENWKYINLPAKEIKEFSKLSILGNEAMYFSCDVGKQLNSDDGTLDVNNYDYGALFGTTFGMDKKWRIQTFESGSSHGMALIGFNDDGTGNIDKWLLENSWGADKGHKGYLAMTDKWFDEYMFRIVVNKKYVSENVLKILDQKPVMLPPWDPMFLPEK
jgi:bleomycin hydrolase